MAVCNLMLTLPVDLVRRAKVIAAQRDTSVSALIADYLRALSEQDDEYDQASRQELKAMSAGLDMRLGSVTWSREDTHQR